MEYPSFWAVTNPAPSQFLATLNLLHQQTGAFIPSPAIIQAESLDSLVGAMPQRLERVPRFTTQAVSVLENWI